MKKSDLEKLVGEDIGYWEIMTVDYEFQTKKLELLLQEFEWKGAMFGRDYKLYLGKLKKVTIYDEYAFTYMEDEEIVNAVDLYIKSHKGLDYRNIGKIVNNPKELVTTVFQTEWKNILQRLNIFNEEEYNQKFICEFKKYFLKYCSEHPEQTDLLKFIGFFEDIATNLKETKVD